MSLRVSNWDRWQSYRSDRGQPPWIKVHRCVMRNPEWVSLSDAQRGQLVAMWILAADKDGELPSDPAMIRRLCYLDNAPDLQLFVSLGFLESDATLASPRRQDDAPEAEAETEAEVEKKQTPPSGETRASGKKRKAALPPDWQPNEGHRKRAKQEGVDLGKEAEKFRLHHEARGSTFVSWDKAFTTWLLRAKDFQPRGRHTPESETDHWDREVERFRDFGKPKPSGLERAKFNLPKMAG